MNKAMTMQDFAHDLKIGEEMLYLSRREVVGLGLKAADILALTRAALIEHGHKRYEMPAKIGVHPYDDVFYHAMPAYVPALGAVGMKWIECYPRNPAEHGIAQTTGLLTLNDVETGAPVATMDATWITAMRTPAVTVLAAAALHPDATSFGMFGCGVQGREHVRLVVHTLPTLETIQVYDRDPEVAEALIRELQPEMATKLVRAETAEVLVKSCEVVSSATVILKEPLAIIRDEWVSPGQTFVPCDMNTFLDPRTSQRADKYIVDSREEHELFAGMGYFPDGLPEISCEIGEVLAGLKLGRARADEVIVNSNIGMAVCDVVVARRIFERALARGVGQRLSL